MYFFLYFHLEDLHIFNLILFFSFLFLFITFNLLNYLLFSLKILFLFVNFTHTGVFIWRLCKMEVSTRSVQSSADSSNFKQTTVPLQQTQLITAGILQVFVLVQSRFHSVYTTFQNPHSFRGCAKWNRPSDQLTARNVSNVTDILSWIFTTTTVPKRTQLPEHEIRTPRGRRCANNLRAYQIKCQNAALHATTCVFCREEAQVSGAPFPGRFGREFLRPSGSVSGRGILISRPVKLTNVNVPRRRTRRVHCHSNRRAARENGSPGKMHKCMSWEELVRRLGTEALAGLNCVRTGGRR